MGHGVTWIGIVFVAACGLFIVFAVGVMLHEGATMTNPKPRKGKK